MADLPDVTVAVVVAPISVLVLDEVRASRGGTPAGPVPAAAGVE